MARSSAAATAYEAPALEKGLDILEALATAGVPRTQAQLARILGRGPNELFRMLVVLERRGYIQRDPTSGAYTLTLRLFELGHTHSPFEALTRAAARPMRVLADMVRESCHLGVLGRDGLLVLAQEEAARRYRLSVDVGRIYPLIKTVSGRVLLAHLPRQESEALLQRDADYAALSPEEQTALRARLDLIREQGFDEAQGETIDGVRDVAVLVGAPAGTMQAALTIAALGRQRQVSRDELLTPLRHAAEEISRTAGLVM